MLRGEGAAVLALPEARGGERIAWSIECEDGTQRTGECVPAERSALDVREIGGTRYARWPLPLPGDLPTGYHRLRLAAPAAESLLRVAPE